MTPSPPWIAIHALPICGLLLSIAVLVGDLAWQHNLRWHDKAILAGREPAVMRWHAGLLLILAMSLLFVAIALAVTASQPGPLARFDTELAGNLRAQLAPAALRVVAVITDLGSTLFIAPLAALIALTLVLRKHRQLAGIWLVTMLAILPINIGLKALFQRARPLHDHGFIVEHSWSFPSGHAFGSMVFYGMLAYVLLRLLPRAHHRMVIVVTVLLTGTIGLSRILLQVHYFSDVVAGYASGAAWLLLCISAAEYLHADSRRSRHNARDIAMESVDE